MINDKFIHSLSQVNRMPNKPGIYIMSNDQGKVIYVGNEGSEKLSDLTSHRSLLTIRSRPF